MWAFDPVPLQIHGAGVSGSTSPRPITGCYMIFREGVRCLFSSCRSQKMREHVEAVQIPVTTGY